MMKIYKITNKINKKVYVGKTTKTIEERFKKHIQNAKNGVKTRFYNAIRKYGKENFEIEIIEDGILNEDILNEKEKYWIKTLNSRIDGYNIAEGGNGGASIVPKHWSKQHHENYQKYLTKEVREKLSKKYSGEGNPMYGKKHSEESIQKMKDLFTPERLNEISKKYSGEGNPMYGKTKEWCEQNKDSELAQKLINNNILRSERMKNKDSELAQKLINNNILQSERMKGKGNPMYGRNDQCYGARKWNESVKGKTAVEIYGEEWAKSVHKKCLIK